MTRISNYEELVAERKRIEHELAFQKASINDEVRDIREKVKPVTDILSFFSNAKKQSFKSTAMQVGANIGIDVFVRNLLLGKANWITKLALPFILKKVTSKVIQKTAD